MHPCLYFMNAPILRQKCNCKHALPFMHGTSCCSIRSHACKSCNSILLRQTLNKIIITCMHLICLNIPHSQTLHECMTTGMAVQQKALNLSDTILRHMHIVLHQVNHPTYLDKTQSCAPSCMCLSVQCLPCFERRHAHARTRMMHAYTFCR